MLERTQTWLLSLSENVTVNDALVRNMAWMLIVWLIAAWMMVRRVTERDCIVIAFHCVSGGHYIL